MDYKSQKLTGFWKADRAMIKIMKVCSYSSGVCLLVMALWATVNVIYSKITHTSIPSTNDWIAYLLVPATFLTAGYEIIDRGLVYVDIVIRRLPAVIYKIVFTISYLVGIAISAFIVERQISLTIYNFGIHKTSSVDKLNFVLWPFSLILGIGVALMGISMFWCILRLYVKRPTFSVEQQVKEGTVSDE